ncbi:MAG: AAA family ATPase, partial [bacterium]
MKFTKAIFKNFRLLRDLELDFSSDTDKRLTVFRAENESGKTTTLVALQWALFGDVALPAKGKEYRLHPIDWDYKSSNRVPIEVMIEFEHTDQVLNPDGNFHEFTKRYRLFRTTTEELNGNKFVKRPSTLSL